MEVPPAKVPMLRRYRPQRVDSSIQNYSYSNITSTGGGPSGDALLLADGTDFLLLADGTDFLLLAQ